MSARLNYYRENYEAWARVFYRIKDKHDKYVPLVLRKPQRMVGELEQRLLRTVGRARIYILKGRQAGFTTDQQARSLHAIWANRGAQALTITDTGENTERIFGITSRALDLWPKTADGAPLLLPKLGDAQASEVSFPARDSIFYTGTAGSKKQGRGITPKRFHGSEFAFWPEPMALLSAILPGLERPGTTAVLETTASGYDSEPHVFWREAKERGWAALFVPWWDCDPELYRTPLLAPDELGDLTGEERDLVERVGVDLEQIKWRREKIREKGRAEFLKEYAEDEESCWLAVGGLFYDSEQLKALMLRAPEPHTRTPFRLGGEVCHYYRDEEGKPAEKPAGMRAIIGGDVAEGVGGDRSTAVVRGFAKDWPLLATYEDNLIDPIAYAALLNELGRKYADAGGPAFLVIEKNAHGITVLRQLRDVHKYPAHRIYHRTTQDKSLKEASEKIGWLTDEASKPLLLDGGRVLFDAVMDGRAHAPAKGVIRDAYGTRRDPKTGKVVTNSRDLLMAELLAWQGRYSIPKGPGTSAVHWG